MKEIKIFLGGGIDLLKGTSEQEGYSNLLKNVVDKHNRRRRVPVFYSYRTFEDFHNHMDNIGAGGQQRKYNSYLLNESHVALFIIDGKLGKDTKAEIEKAIQAYEKRSFAHLGKRKRPKIYVYARNIEDDSEVVAYLNSIQQYYVHFSSREELADKITDDLSDASIISLESANRTKICLFSALALVLLTMFYWYSSLYQSKKEIFANEMRYKLSTQLLTMSELNDLYNDGNIELARCAILANHGYDFNDNVDMKKLFSSFRWYKLMLKDSVMTDKLNAFEETNRVMLKNAERLISKNIKDTIVYKGKFDKTQRIYDPYQLSKEQLDSVYNNIVNVRLVERGDLDKYTKIVRMYIKNGIFVSSMGYNFLKSKEYYNYYSRLGYNCNPDTTKNRSGALDMAALQEVNVRRIEYYDILFDE